MMNRAKSKSPSPTKSKGKEQKHWSQRMHESIVSSGPEGLINFAVKGGAEYGQFCWIGEIKQDKINYHSGKLHQDEILLEVQGQKVSGYTLRDFLDWLKQVSRNSTPVMFKTVKSGLLPKDLRTYLNTRFTKNSLDHDLQQTIRDNLYMRTVPCTTRTPRPGEINGVDYTFLTVDEFLALEKSGNLLESGLYDGNNYGTPKPPKDPTNSTTPFRRTNSAGTLLPGNHPSSEGKRRRNRSNIETTTTGRPSSKQYAADDSEVPTLTRKHSLERAQSTGSLGPLPSNWEMAFAEDGTTYFIDHNTETTHWLDPRLVAKNKGVAECDENDATVRSKNLTQPDDPEKLPYGWEKVEDPHYGTYYIDHVNRKTQYENPVTKAKRQAKDGSASPQQNNGSGTGSLPRHTKYKNMEPNRSGTPADINGRQSPLTTEVPRPFFTKKPEELHGEFIKTELLKSPRGFGFTIVGGDDTDEEFLQIKNVVQNGPAYEDGKLKPSDVLVFVNDQCVLGYTHQDMVNMFQQIQVEEKVKLEVCRGYPLPFDPDDPNTEIVTTVAVSLPETGTSNTPPDVSRGHNRGDGDNMNVTARNNKSMPDLSSSSNMQDSNLAQRNKSYDELNNDEDVMSSLYPGSNKPELLSVNITKGPMGFGFTIADSAYGQKVKHILDNKRCQDIQQGDILVEINHARVKDTPHADVVQVLKNCPKGVESNIVIQRGGMLTPLKGRRPPSRNSKSADEVHKSQREDSFSNVPRSPFYSPGENKAENNNKPKEDMTPGKEESAKADEKGVQKNGVKEETKGENNDTKQEKEKDLVNDGQQSFRGNDTRRPKTPTESRAKTPNSDHRSKTPVIDNMDPSKRRGGFNDRTDMNSSRESYNSRSEYMNSKPDPYNQYMYNNNSHERIDYQADRSRPEMRSRTPGPEFMRGNISDDQYLRARSHEMRSKTPTHELLQYHHTMSGTPDFIPASKYQPPANDKSAPYINNDSRNQEVPYRPHPDNYDRRQRPVSQPDFSNTHGGSRINSSQNYAANIDPYTGQNRSFDNMPGHPYPESSQLYPIDGDRHKPRKQSTSFEHQEPTPSNLTRIQRNGPYDSPSGSLDRSRSPPRGDQEPRYVELSVTLNRQESGFGFRIIGGTEEGSQVSVGHIIPGGAADVDGRLRTGDEIISVGGHDMIGASHHKVVQIMGQTVFSGRVTIGIRRRIGGVTDSPHKNQIDQFPYDVTVIRREDEGFGFVIISSVTKAGSTIDPSSSLTNVSDWTINLKRPVPWIGRIIENSPAERCPRLHVGDRILAVNGKDIARMHHEDIVNLIKDSGYSVTLTIGPPQDDASSTASTSQRSSQGSMINAMAYPAHSESDISSRRSDYSPYHQSRASSQTPQPYPHQVMERHKEMIRQRSQGGASSDIDEDKFYAVELHRGSRGFGFSIRGGQEFNSMPLFVLRIADGGAADLDGRLKVGDQLIEINGYNTTNMTHAEAIDLIQSGGSTVRLLVKRTGKPPPNVEKQPISGSRTPQPSSIPSSLPNGPLGQSSPGIGRQDPRMDQQYPYNYQQYHNASHSNQHSHNSGYQ